MRRVMWLLSVEQEVTVLTVRMAEHPAELLGEEQGSSDKEVLEGNLLMQGVWSVTMLPKLALIRMQLAM